MNLFKNLEALIIAGASAAGKGDQIKLFSNQFPTTFAFSVSATNRPRRLYEVDGTHYHFIESEQRFQRMIDAGHFAEWHLNDNGFLYGTLRSELERIKRLEKIGLFDTEAHGALHLFDSYPPGAAHSVFLYANDEVRAQRLQQRGTETEAERKKRIEEGLVQFKMYQKNKEKFVFIDTSFLNQNEVFELIKESLIARAATIR